MVANKKATRLQNTYLISKVVIFTPLNIAVIYQITTD